MVEVDLANFCFLGYHQILDIGICQSHTHTYIYIFDFFLFNTFQ